MRSAHHSIRTFNNKKIAGSKKTSYPPEERFNPEFIKEVEQAQQEIQDGKGIKFKTVDDLFSYLKK
ncbi:DUF2683 family protein [Methanolobus psychrotolerans]|uniref:DUF2683 family protein n=1 Tax=Methanolobus psychrotolerans TaxID=1874706 RepID=UPI000B91A1C9|nr:DUF2683 family protein [Methanolobus psychrotolerans]